MGRRVDTERAPLLLGEQVYEDAGAGSTPLSGDTHAGELTPWEEQAARDMSGEKLSMRELLNNLEATTSDIWGILGDEKAVEHTPRAAPKLGPKFTKRLLLLTIFWQILNVVLLSILDSRIPEESLKHHNATGNALFVGIIVMGGFQTLQLILLIATSIKLAKQLVHGTASAGFLVQSYLSTILLYAGIYTLLHRVEPKAWVGMEPEGPFTSKYYIVKTFVMLLYFSTSTITSVGYGDIYPRTWYLYLICSSQMLIGVVYTVAILGRGLEVIAQGAYIGGLKIRLPNGTDDASGGGAGHRERNV